MRKAPAVKSLPGILGPVSVTLVDKIKDNNGAVVEDCLGYYLCGPRTIQIERGQCKAQEQQTTEHEWSHMVLFDTGVRNLLSHEQTEAICDAFGLALVMRLHRT